MAAEDNANFIKLLKRVGQNRTEGCPLHEEVDFKCPAFFRHKTLWIHTLTVTAAGIKVYVITKITSLLCVCINNIIELLFSVDSSNARGLHRDPSWSFPLGDKSLCQRA